MISIPRDPFEYPAKDNKSKTKLNKMFFIIKGFRGLKKEAPLHRQIY